MGLFSKLTSKETCVLCGKEVGALHRSKLKTGEYICNECNAKCSGFIRASEMNKEEVEEHIAFMETRNRIYTELFKDAKKSCYPEHSNNYELVFADELGMLAIVNKKHRRVNTEVLRYDEIERYEPYRETMDQDGKEVLKEEGVILHPVPANTTVVRDENGKGLRPHPYINHEMKLAFRTDEKERSYVEGAIARLDGVFGVHDNATALFAFHSTQEKREIDAGRKMAGMFGTALKAAVKGEVDEDAVKEQFEDAKTAANLAETGGMSRFTDAADKAEEKVGGYAK